MLSKRIIYTIRKSISALAIQQKKIHINFDIMCILYAPQLREVVVFFVLKIFSYIIQPLSVLCGRIHRRVHPTHTSKMKTFSISLPLFCFPYHKMCACVPCVHMDGCINSQTI